MDRSIEHDELDEALRRCGAGWNAAQAHGLLCSRLAVQGADAAANWLHQVLQGADPASESWRECAAMLEELCSRSDRHLAARLSEFEPLLPADDSPASSRAEALAHWAEGFLHGLVSGPHRENLKSQLAAPPISDIIKDMLQISRATDDGEEDESSEEAYAELVEYVRVAAQLTYEELAGCREAASGKPEAGSDSVH